METLENQNMLRKALVAYSYVGIWIFLSGVVITYNKFLLAVAGFPYPISLTLWYGIRSTSRLFIHLPSLEDSFFLAALKSESTVMQAYVLLRQYSHCFRKIRCC